MKKAFKVISIIVIVILVLVGGIFGFRKIKEVTMNNERRNAKTLMEYVKTHSYEYVDDSKDEMSFRGKDLKCVPLKDLKNENIKGIIRTYNETLIILLDDSSYLSLSLDNEKIYSNNQNCNKVDTKIKVKDIKKYKENYYIVSDDNKIYYIIINDNYEVAFEEMQTEYDLSSYILLKDDVQSIVELDTASNIGIVLKNDGSLYKQEYNANYNSDASKVIFSIKKEEIFLPNDEYGNILNAVLNYDYDKKEYEIRTLVTDKGYYYYGEVETEECVKYQDIKCEKKILESEIYKKFSKDIKYIGDNYTILSDNSIIETNYLTYSLDKDLRN